ncbi:hypothetical protein [Janthinobacterium sp. J1-1]|uniref:hypothetical protein n=1 Tax=unclassified Janthinobacterium TaxID=2610881 RepID=UPI0028126CA7|nr:hypothetical protein [Janthinobacterium sp. J1-1]
MTNSSILKICITTATLLLFGCDNHKPANKSREESSIALAAKTQEINPPMENIAILAGPFGLAKGVTTEQLTGAFGFKAAETASNVYAGIPPRPVEGLVDYIVLATKRSGLCRIVASTPVAVANDSGDQVKASVDRLAESLKIKYGDTPVKTNYVGSGTFKRNPDMWMIGLKDDSVIYGYTWESKAAAPLHNELRAVEVTAQASDSSNAYAKIVYTFNNFDDCAKDIKSMQAQNL